MVKSISVLGSTGSVGCQTLEAARQLGLKVSAISGNSNIALLEKQARQFQPEFVAIFDENAAKQLKIALGDTDIKVASGMTGLIECAAAYGDCVVTAVSGAVGLKPTLAAIDESKRIALANKETLVCAGEIVMRRAKEKNAEIIPVDSEHSAIFQCLEAEGKKKALTGIMLTASGGPFRGKTRAELAKVTPQQAVSHPNWSMGAKISVDSASLMNKGLEFIEAMHLFELNPEQIRILVHPESIIHSMAYFTDGSVIAQLSQPDMGLPIRYALTYPEREPSDLQLPDFLALGALSFHAPDMESFPCLPLAINCAKLGKSAPAVMNAANEEVVSAFLSGKTGFNDIYSHTAAAVNALADSFGATLEEIEAADFAARQFVKNIIGNTF